jgi:GT2 family glycosyltransferase/SAM-dependent methyltransferase
VTDIAVVVPCHNLGHTLLEAVDSVIAQTRPAREILVVDDGSTDARTREVLEGLRRRETRVVSTPHRGAAAARNQGVRQTWAPYVVTLAADDRLDARYLEAAAGRLDRDPTLDFVSTAIRAFGDASYVWTPPPCTLLNVLTRGGPHQASMFRRRTWELVGGFDETAAISGCEDLDFWVSALERGLRGEVIAEPLLHYRVRADSRHHGAVEGGSHRQVMEAVLRKHRASVEALGPAVLIAKESLIVAQKAHLAALDREQGQLEEELAALAVEIARTARRARRLPGGPVSWGDLRRVQPLSAVWGLDRGTPVDRHYIQRFLEARRGDIRGRVLEVKDSGYTERYGKDAVIERHVIDVDPRNPVATMVADLTRADTIGAERFDCFILTQTLHVIPDIRAAIAHAHRVLTPGGVLLATLPCVSRIAEEEVAQGRGDYWRFTEASARLLFQEVFPPAAVEVSAAGNTLACAAFLYGLAAEELTPAELDHLDPACPLILLVRAVKPKGHAAG